MVSGRSRRAGVIFLGLAAVLAILFGGIMIQRAIGREPQPAPALISVLPLPLRAAVMVFAVCITLAIITLVFYIGWRFYRGGANLRLTTRGLEFPLLPGIRLAWAIAWVDVQDVRELSRELLLPAGAFSVRMNRWPYGSVLALVIDTVRPTAGLDAGS